ncbi:MAG TPA: hypothetical protein VH186_38410 [Chloroflexia bacterium]|nr:hypothetical protein [Chloroflexia bacterium]
MVVLSVRHKKLYQLIVALLVSFLLTFFFALVPRAHASEGIVIYDQPNVNGYHVTVLTTPNPTTVGKISLFIRLGKPTGANDEAPVRGGTVGVEIYHVSGPGADNSTSYVQRKNLVAGESEPGTYEVSDSLQNEGGYRITLNITAEGKNFQTGFDINALPPPDDRFLSVLLLSLFPIFLAWLVWMYLKRPGSRRPSGQTQATPESATETAVHS